MTPLTIDKVQAALEQTNGNVSAAARLLKVSRVTLHKWKRRIVASHPVGT